MVIRRMLLGLILLMTGSLVLADSWSPISIVDAPTARAAHSAVFTRIDVTDQMIVWGGQDSPMVPFADTGARWKRSTNTWAATTTTNAPAGRETGARGSTCQIWLQTDCRHRAEHKPPRPGRPLSCVPTVTLFPVSTRLVMMLSGRPLPGDIFLIFFFPLTMEQAFNP